MNLYTKNGKPLQVTGITVYSRSGKVVGCINGSKVFGINGRYVGTIVGDRLVYRSTDDNTRISSPFFVFAANRAGTLCANRTPSSILGNEPDIPD